MSELGWGVIGAGRFGLIHARTIRSIAGCRLAGLANRNEARLADAAREFPGVPATTDYRRLLDDPSIDIVSITTHWQDHLQPSLDAFAAGKHVLLEKPMAADAEECRRLMDAAERASTLLMVGHICRFDPRVALAREAVLQGRIGRIVSMHARRNLPRAAGSLRLDKISPLMGDGIHDADLMMWMIGEPPTRVFARNVRVDDFRYPDLGWAMLEFGDRAIGVVETIWCLPENTPTVIDARMEIVGTKGKLDIDCSATGLQLLDAAGLKSIDTDYWPFVHGSPAGVLRFELEHFADCVRHGIQSPVVAPREASRAVDVIQHAERSARIGAPIDFIDSW